MSKGLTIQPTDHLVGKAITPGVYRVKITNYDETRAKAGSKNPGSQNFGFEAHIVGGDYNGVPLRWTFNEAAAISRKLAGEFIAAVTGHKVDQQKEVTITTEMFRKCIGMELRVSVKNTIDGNNTYNNVDGYLPLNG